MNFKIKSLALAVALAACAGTAFADIQPGNNQSTSKNGEVVFYAYGFDSNGNAATYVKDLGVSFDSFVTTKTYAAVDLDTDANWTSFLGANLVGAKNWGLFATQKTSASTTAANGFKLLTTAKLNDASQAMSNANMGLAFGNANNAIVAINAGGTNYAANSSYYFAPAAVDNTAASGNFGAYLGSDFASTGVFFNATNVIGTTTTATFFNVARGAGNAANGVPTVADVDSTKVWKFGADNVLTYTAAVPEPESYAMFFAGLMMVGAIARRRRI